MAISVSLNGLTTFCVMCRLWQFFAFFVGPLTWSESFEVIYSQNAFVFGMFLCALLEVAILFAKFQCWKHLKDDKPNNDTPQDTVKS